MLPLSTTTVSILRLPTADLYEEPYGGSDVQDRTTVASGIRAVIDQPGGSLQVEGGQQNIANYGLKCDPISGGENLHYLDLIQDDRSGRTFRIVWFIDHFDHIEAVMRDVEGEA